MIRSARGRCTVLAVSGARCHWAYSLAASTRRPGRVPSECLPSFWVAGCSHRLVLRWRDEGAAAQIVGSVIVCTATFVSAMAMFWGLNALKLLRVSREGELLASISTSTGSERTPGTCRRKDGFPDSTQRSPGQSPREANRKETIGEELVSLQSLSASNSGYDKAKMILLMGIERIETR